MPSETESLTGWLERRREAAPVTVRRQPWAENPEWVFRDGALVHVSGGFFSIVGVRLDAPGEAFDGQSLALIDQPEIGLLGFIVRQTPEGPQWLLQAKAEPGATGFTQIGPSVQATQSNYRRLHGGGPTRFLDLFDPGSPGLVADSEQSEQGGRFLDKHNRNAVRLVETLETPEDDAWRWAGAAELRGALAQDFTVNTDARSVIACADWRWLCEDGEPFCDRDPDPADPPPGLRRALRASWVAGDPSIAAARALLAEIGERRRCASVRTPLDALEGWRVGPDDITAPADHPYDIVSCAVAAPHRERRAWSQPLLRGLGRQACRLVLAEIDGEMRAFFAVAREPGFGDRVELGPSWQSDRANAPGAEDASAAAAPLAVLNQSDEGGRFMQSEMRYELRLAETPEALSLGEGAWLNLAQIEQACRTPGVMTNEARSAVSLLLAWA